jgi:hypothetical protein
MMLGVRVGGDGRVIYRGVVVVPATARRESHGLRLVALPASRRANWGDLVWR